jgi:hypothetical protein
MKRAQIFGRVVFAPILVVVLVLAGCKSGTITKKATGFRQQASAKRPVA